jgi:hypothetical protein
MPRYEYAIGATLETIKYLFDYSPKIMPPLSSFRPYSKAVETGAGGVLGMGWATAEWNWGFLPDDQRAHLKTLCPGLSAVVYVRILNDSLATPAWETYRAKMLWTPEPEDRQNANRMKARIVFRLLEHIEDEEEE